MPAKKKSHLSKVSAQSRGKKRHRDEETAEETQVRLAEQVERTKRVRANETQDQTQERLALQDERTRRARASETSDRTQERLAQQDERSRRARASETSDETQERLTQQDERTRRVRANETAEQTQERLTQNDERTRRARAKETAEQIQERLTQQDDRTRRVRANETAEQTQLSEKLKRITSSLHKIIECPVCLESIKLPFKQCGRGHCICTDCTKNVEVCPICQELFTIENPICLKNLLEGLPRFCCYADIGCEVVVEEGHDHEIYCAFRNTTCKKCEIKLPVCQLLVHYNEKHPNIYVLKNPNESTVWSKFNPEKERTGTNLVSLFNNFFWIILKNDIKKKQLKLTFEATPIGKMIDDYYVCAKFQNKNFNYCYTIKACISKDERNANDDVGKNVEKFCMKVPQSALTHLIDNDGNLDCEFIFFTVKKQ